ncbi:hypothetical protein C0992_010590, partial [Termitomyces sp. T32_za158]
FVLEHSYYVPDEPYLSTGGQVGGVLSFGVSMFGVSLVGGVDLFVKELVEAPEVLGNFVGDVRGDILEGERESGMVAFISKEG